MIKIKTARRKLTVRTRCAKTHCRKDTVVREIAGRRTLRRMLSGSYNYGQAPR